MKVLIAEDNTSSRLLLYKVLSREGYSVVSASDGQEAFNILLNEKVDAVLTDWMMPRMDGLELTEKIRSSIKPVPVIIMITALASPEAHDKALMAGADGYIAKPFVMDELLESLRNCLLRLKQEKSNPVLMQAQQGSAEKPDKSKQPGFIAVGIAASTGGPSTLMHLFSGLKTTQKAAFFVVLHGPAWMLKSFSARVQGLTSMKVLLADNGMKIKRGHVYIAPGDVHTSINARTLELELLDTPPENYVKPSADPLFRSIAAAFGSNSLGVVLTGMGHDGSIGSGYISAAGGTVIAQDPSTAILPSMPQSVIDLRIAKVVAPLEQMGSVIIQTIEKISSI